MNIVALIGNVASAPEVRQTGSGKTVCSFRLAVSRIGSDQADFFTVITWERQAEVCQEYLSIGRRIAVEGRMRHTTWETEEREKRSRVEVIANRVELLNRSQRQLREEAEAAEQAVREEDEAAVAGAADDPFRLDEHGVPEFAPPTAAVV